MFVAVAAVLVLSGTNVARAARGSAQTGLLCGNSSTIKSSGITWHCSFDDEFSGTTLDATKWAVERTALNGFHSGAECFADTPNNVSVGNGYLSLTVRQEAAPFVCNSPLGNYTTSYSSGMVTTWNRFSQAYGRFEVRAILPSQAIQGLQESFWLWPDAQTYGSYPTSGEIDWAEIYSDRPGKAVPFIHYSAAAPDPNVTSQSCYITDVTSWHRYAVEWTPSSIKIVYDGTTCLVDTWNPAAPLTRPQPFDQPFYVNLTQALGIKDNQFDPATSQLPATTKVDYVRVWKQ